MSLPWRTSAAAFLHVRFLEVRGAAVFLVARTDVAAALGEVALFMAADAGLEKGILELGEKRRVAADKTGVEQGRLGLVILVREFAGLLHRAHRIAHLETEVEEHHRDL